MNRPGSLIPPHCIEIVIPIQLSTIVFDAFLFFHLNQELESGLNDGFFGLELADRKGLIHEVVIYYDIGPHVVRLF
jgi:hypothetical protein